MTVEQGSLMDDMKMPSSMSIRPRGKFTLHELDFSIPSYKVRELLIARLRETWQSIPVDAEIESFEWYEEDGDIKGTIKVKHEQ